MTVPFSNADLGASFERNVCELVGAEDVSQDGGDHRHVDAIGPDSERIAIKVARFRIDDGQRRGRYWIPREEIEACDRYAMGVYRQGGDIEPICRFYSADAVLHRCPSFVDSGRRDVDEVSRPPWSRFISPSTLGDHAVQREGNA